ncbi:acyltransferase family protein [Aquimarina rubra]|uniref:Acyltransferase family protein n=1 Tax=Aquimarina rubra TaxID=1920033 RepID=A0ABW5LGZ5_9FLAO
MENRIDSLDYLRGLMALGIMIYHYFSWTYGSYGSESFLGILGIYGVSTFYVLSGLTLYVVYSKRLTIDTILHFTIKRFFRIYPLLWISIFLTIFLLNKTFDIKTIWLNISGLFGFLAHDKYISTGAWSIGNELVFYAFFPLIILFAKKIKFFVEAFFIASLFVAIYFAFFYLDVNQTLGKQWSIYINPLNQLFLFSGGILIGKLIGSYRNNLISLFLLFVTVLILVFYPVSGNRINLLVDWNRLLFASLCFVITIVFLLMDFPLSKWINKILSKLGHISYTVYLIHPIVFWYLNKFKTIEYFNKSIQPEMFIGISIITTFLISIVIYELIEYKFIKIGRALTKQKSSLA